MSDKKYQGVTRAVCIGLGGTGLQTIMRLRRFIVERYGSLDKFPIVRFVQIDTDNGSLDNANLGGKTFHRGVDISLKSEEKVHIGMNATDADSLRRALKNSQSGTPYEHIREWLPDYVIDNAKAIDKGAGGIRPVGRLAFFHNYSKIKSAIDFAERQTRGTYPHLMQEFGLIQDNGLDIFIVGSLYGGTGSGTFLDVAYSVRNLYPNDKVYGYLVVNPELQGTGFDQQANIYAALMELDFYSRGNDFKAWYDRNDPQSRIDSNGKPPFSYTFLIGRNTNNPRYVIEEKDKLFNLIAQKISIEFSSRLAPKLKEKRDDFNFPLSQNDNYPRPNPQYYLTFGLSEIYCPIDRIIEITAARVSVSLMQFWQTGFGQAPDSMTLMLTFYTTYSWYDDLNQRIGFPEKKLGKIPLEGNNTADSLLTTWKSGLERDLISTCQSDSDRESLSSQITTSFRNQFRKVEFGESDAMRGVWLTKIMREVDNYITQYQQNIEDFRLRLLNPREENFSIGNAQIWISKLSQELNDNRLRLQKEIGALGAEKSLETLEPRWREMEKQIEAENREFSWFGFRNKNQTVRTIARKTLEETRKAIEHNRKLLSAQQALIITDKLSKYCQGISAGLIKSKNISAEVEVKYRQIEIDRRDMNLNELNGEAIFTEQDVSSAESSLIPTQDRLVNYQQITDELCRELQIDRSLVELLNQTTIDDTIQKLDQVLERIFSTRLLSFGRPVIEAFLEKYQPAQPEANTRLGEILEMSAPRLALNIKDPYYTAGTPKRFVGFLDEQTSSVERFKILLNQNQSTDAEWVKLTDKDRFLVITEFAPFPLRIIKDLDIYGFQYKDRIDDNKPLHNDKRIQFTNIMPPTREEIAKLQDLFFPCLALGFLEDYKQPSLKFRYWSAVAANMKDILLQGNWDQCMESIQNNTDLFDGLAVLLEEFEARLDPETWGKGITADGNVGGVKATIDTFRQYVSNIGSGYNFRYKDSLIKKGGILDRYRDKIETMLRDRPSTNSSQTNSNILSGNSDSINAELVDELNNTKPSFNSEENRKKSDEKIANCKKALENDVINQGEYNRKVEEIKRKYPT